MALNKKNNLLKVSIAMGTSMILLGCASVPKGILVSETKEKIEKVLTDERILKLSDLDEDTSEYFLESAKNAEPGIVCGAFMNENQTSCVVLLVSKNSKSRGSKRLIFIKDIANVSQISETIEDYSSEKRLTTNMFVTFQKKAILENRGEGPSTVQMSQDGVLRIAYGQSALVLFWDKERIQRVWTAD